MGYTIEHIVIGNTTYDLPTGGGGSGIQPGSDTYLSRLHLDGNSNGQLLTFSPPSGSYSMPQAELIFGNDVGYVWDAGEVPLVFQSPIAVVGGFFCSQLQLSEDVGVVVQGAFVVDTDIATADAVTIVDGTINATTVNANTFNATSDRKLKENIKDTELDYNYLLDNLHIVDFNFIKDPTKQTNIGLVAQELQEILPEKYKDLFVHTCENKDKTDSYLTISENKLVYVALLALKDQKKKIEDLEARIEALENK